MPWWDYLYLRWPAQPPWGSLSPLLSHWRWPRDAPGAPGTAGYSGTQKPWGSSRMWSKRLLSDKRAGLNRNQYQCLDGDEPADQTEPGEAVVEGIASGQSVVTVLHSTAGELCSTVVHFSHQVQPLPAGGSVTGAKNVLRADISSVYVLMHGSKLDIETELE